jgi:hypothetical protein
MTAEQKLDSDSAWLNQEGFDSQMGDFLPKNFNNPYSAKPLLIQIFGNYEVGLELGYFQVQTWIQCIHLRLGGQSNLKES